MWFWPDRLEMRPGAGSLLTSLLVIQLLALAPVNSQFVCPDKGVYPDPVQCDKYWVSY